MQTPKFRAWHKELKQLFPMIILDLLYKRVFVEAPDSNDFLCGHGYYWDLKDIELMQCTGLRDRHNKDIYIGDICKVWGEFHYDEEVLPYYVAEIFYHTVSGKLVLTSCKLEYSEDYSDALADDVKLEIIGNIYEHGELLKAAE